MSKLNFRAFISAVAVVGAADPAAGAQRTFVASTGVDTNPCTLMQPSPDHG